MVPDVEAVAVEVVSVVDSSSVESLPLLLSLPDLSSFSGVGINDTRRFIELALGPVADEEVGVVLVLEVVLRDVAVVVPVADVDPEVLEREVVPESESEDDEELDEEEVLSSEDDESDSDEDGSSRRLRRAGGI